MIPHGVEIFVCLEPIDLRWSFDRLSNLAAARVGREARCGALFVFFGRRQDALKVLFFDGTGMRPPPTRVSSPSCSSSTMLAQSAVDRFKNAAFDLVVEGESYRPRLKPAVRDDDPPPAAPVSKPEHPIKRRKR